MQANGKSELRRPWSEFLSELDGLLTEEIMLHCTGGFVVSAVYGFPRPTADIDFVEVLPGGSVNALLDLAGIQSPLAKKHKVYLQFVKVNTMPEDYEQRLTDMFPGKFRNLRLMAPEPYDLILSKIERNGPKDRDDVEYMARKLTLSSEVFDERYRRDLRPNLANENRHDLTVKHWKEDLFPHEG
jgi:hypothetical protein